jgi:pimeloyl-ACP methyl ester carboxylesterase
MKKEAGYFEKDDLKLYYEVTGKGNPIVFIHGFTLDTRFWDEQVAFFSNEFKVITYDQRGHGRSGMPGTKTYSHYEDLKLLLDYLEIDQAIVNGLSIGGLYALEFTVAYPERVEKLILSDTSGINGINFPKEIKKGFGDIYLALKEKGLEAAKKVWSGFEWFIPAMKIPAAEKVLSQILNDYSGWHWMNKNPTENLNPPVNERLNKIDKPVLIITGEKDTTYNHEISELLKSGISGAKEVVIKGAGHFPNLEDPENYNQVVYKFLKENI